MTEGSPNESLLCLRKRQDETEGDCPLCTHLAQAHLTRGMWEPLAWSEKWRLQFHMCTQQQLRSGRNPPSGGLGCHSQVQSSSCVHSLHRWQEAPKLPSTNTSANCGWRMATSKFHLLLFCHLLYSETHSSEAQAHWDSDKFYRLWCVTSTRLHYFNINSLPNLNPIKYILQGPGMAVILGTAPAECQV